MLKSNDIIYLNKHRLNENMHQNYLNNLQLNNIGMIFLSFPHQNQR